MTEFKIEKRGEGDGAQFMTLCEVDGQEMPISVAYDIAHIRQAEAHVAFYKQQTLHNAAMRELCEREAKAMERIAIALERPR